MQMAALDGEDAALQRALAESMQTTGGLACKIAVLTKLPTSRAALAQQQHCMEVSSCRLFPIRVGPCLIGSDPLAEHDAPACR